MRLFAVELRRFFSRRAVAVILLVTVAAAGLLVASAAYSTRPADATEQAAAERMLERQLELDAPDLATCLEDPEEYFAEGATAEECERSRPTLDWFLPRPRLDLGDEAEGRGRTLLVLLAGVGIVVGATFAGADWTSGSMSNQLLFRPRRLRLWATKAAAVVVATTVTGGVVLAGFWAALAAFASARDLRTPDADWTMILQTSGRGLALLAAVTLGGFALTMAMRHTVGTLGLLFAYAVAGEGLAASLPVERMSQWSMANNVMAWLHNGWEVYDPSICENDLGACSSWYTLPLSHAAAYLGSLLLLAVVASLITFRRRDVA